ncbi:MAG: hypothetical protein HY867_01640 [Chloroflexi bacterium]|nr:hypothetical protein [Chloroflexota bacterium]
MPELSKSQLEKAVVDAIQKGFPGSTDFVLADIGIKMAEGVSMYAEFKRLSDNPADAKRGRMQEDFCYVIVFPNGDTKLLDNGEELVLYFQALLDRKRTVWQRFSELNFNDMIGAFIAFAVIGGFTFLIIHAALNNIPPEDWISKEFLAIVSMVLGFYFGRNPKSKD